MNNETPMTPHRATVARDFMELRRCKAERNSLTSTGGKASNDAVAAMIGLVGDSVTGFVGSWTRSLLSGIGRWNLFPGDIDN